MRHVETLVWPGGEHGFLLGIGQLRAIEQRSDAGVAVVMMRLLGQQWKVDDVVNTIRLGLIGGGLPEKDAQQAIDTALETANLYTLAITAAEILRRFIMWESDDRPGETAAEEEVTSHPSATDAPAGQPSTAPAP